MRYPEEIVEEVRLRNDIVEEYIYAIGIYPICLYKSEMILKPK